MTATDPKINTTEYKLSPLMQSLLIAVRRDGVWDEHTIRKHNQGTIRALLRRSPGLLTSLSGRRIKISRAGELALDLQRHANIKRLNEGAPLTSALEQLRVIRMTSRAADRDEPRKLAEVG